jgi:hypothetical protein
MKRIAKIAALASALVVILALSITSVAMAAGPTDPVTCPNPDCTKVCPNPDCTGSGDQLQGQHQNGLQATKGSAFRHQYRTCQ